MGGNFNLLYRGKAWNFMSQSKKLNLLYFGYTRCPDVCPLSLSNAGSAFHQLPYDIRDQIRFIFVSVDHRHDKPDDPADFAINFYPDFIGDGHETG
ncbi:MAG: SCO family protein [Bdellovibrionaceae bacterium]|nr:SCO family protein [Pseudobdellovibrionaceae bacterium]